MRKLFIEKEKNDSLINFDIQKCPLTYDFYIHSHDFTEIVVILNGSAIHIIDGTEYPISKGHIYVINQGTQHGYKDVNNLEYFNIMFKLEDFFLSDELKKLPGFQALLILEPFYRKNDNFSSKLVLGSIELKKVETILDSILEEYLSKQDGYNSMIQSYLTALLIFLSREYYFNKENYSKKIFKLSEVISLIETKYTENITIDILSSMSCMSKRNFIRVFKHNYGTTPIDYIMNLRFKKACELLKSSNNSISQIALECGFDDPNYFSRQFKKQIGKTPMQWRKSIHG